MHHYGYYFQNTGKTFRSTNGEFTESANSTLRRSEETHGFKVVRKLGTPLHKEKSLKSLTFFNSKRIGGNPVLKMRLPTKKSSINCYPHVLDEINIFIYIWCVHGNHLNCMISRCAKFCSLTIFLDPGPWPRPFHRSWHHNCFSFCHGLRLCLQLYLSWRRQLPNVCFRSWSCLSLVLHVYMTCLSKRTGKLQNKIIFTEII